MAERARGATMNAVAIEKFGGPEVLVVREAPVPEVGPNEVRIRVEAAGVGVWDPFEREGGYARMLHMDVRFPYVLGSEGAGTIVAVGDGVSELKPGDVVYAAGFLNPKGGFYAEHAAVDASLVVPVPRGMPIEQAAGLAGVGLTALRGLDDALRVSGGESLVVFGASGGVGHVAVQLAKRMGCRVLAVASGRDGVALAGKLGADLAVDGREDDVRAAVRSFAPSGADAALLTAGGEVAHDVLRALREGGRAAYPNGVQSVPVAPEGVELRGYHGDPDADILARLDRLVRSGPFEVHVDRSFPLEHAAQAHLAVEQHHLGKIVLRVRARSE